MAKRAKRAPERTLTNRLPSATLAVVAERADLAMSLRQEMANGTITIDGVVHEIECAMSMNGAAVLVTITPPKPKDGRSFWRTYALRTGELLKAVSDHYAQNPPTEDEMRRSP